MTLLSEAIARYHRILEDFARGGSAWVGELHAQLERRGLAVNGRPVSPVLRPHFLTRRQYDTLASAAEALSSAISRVRELALREPSLMARLGLLPGERMLVSLDPGYSIPAVASLLEASVVNGHLHLSAPRADLPRGAVFSELLSEAFLETAPMKEFRKRHKVSRAPGVKPLVAGLLKAWKEFGGKGRPAVAILAFAGGIGSSESCEDALLAEFLRSQGFAVEVVSPEEVEYQGGVLRRGPFRIDMILRGVRAQDLLTRYDLSHRCCAPAASAASAWSTASAPRFCASAPCSPC